MESDQKLAHRTDLQISRRKMPIETTQLKVAPSAPETLNNCYKERVGGPHRPVQLRCNLVIVMGSSQGKA